jgi:hypothetical protein
MIFSVVGDDDTTVMTAADIGANYNIIVADASSVTGISGTYLDTSTIATTATLPCQLLDIVRKPGNAFGNTATTVEVEVMFVTHHLNRFGSTGATT